MGASRSEGDDGACWLLDLPGDALQAVHSFVTDVLDRAAVRATNRRSRALFCRGGATSLDLTGRRNVIRLLEGCPWAPQITHLKILFAAHQLQDGAALIHPLERFISLLSVDVGGCYDLQPTYLIRCLTQLAQLQAACFYWCPNLNDSFVRTLVATTRSLRYLNLSGAKHLTNNAVCEIATNLHQLRYLDCTKLVQLSDRTLIALSRSRSASVLQTLIFYACPNFTNLGLRILVKGCQSLCYFDICGSLHITDQGIEYLAKRSSHLERLNLSWCILLTDRSLVSLAQYCPRLARLELRGVQHISDNGIMALSRDRRNWIRELDVVGCLHVTSATKANVQRLFPRLPGLTKC